MATIAVGADLLLVHHGLFWNGVQPVVGPHHTRLRALLDHDIAVYSAHLPLDLHPVFGNNVLLAKALGLVPTGEFARFESIAIGVRGTADVPTAELVARAALFAQAHGGDARASAATRPTDPHLGDVQRRWSVRRHAGRSRGAREWTR